MTGRMIRYFLSAALLALVALSAAASTIRLGFSIDPAETLPYLPVSFHIVAENQGAAPAPLPRYAVLEVTPEKGAPFLTMAGSSRQERFAAVLLTGPEHTPYVLAPGERKRIDFLAGPESPPWRIGPFWNTPGRYRLRLIADEGLTERNLTGEALTLQEPWLVDPVASNSVALTIRTPTGADAEVVKLIQAKGFWNDAVAEEVWVRFPSSEYAAYMVRDSQSDDPDVVLANYGAALRKNPRGLFGYYFRETMANAHADKAWSARRTDLGTVIRETEAARALLEQNLALDIPEEVKRSSREWLGVVGTVEGRIDLHYDLRNLPMPSKCERTAVAAVREQLAPRAGDAALTPAARAKLTDAIRRLDDFAAHVARNPGDLVAALGELEKAAGDLEGTPALGDPRFGPADAERWLRLIVSAAEKAVQKALVAAEGDSRADARKLADARALVAESQKLRILGTYKNAIAKLQAALAAVEKATTARPARC